MMYTDRANMLAVMKKDPDILRTAEQWHEKCIAVGWGYRKKVKNWQASLRNMEKEKTLPRGFVILRPEKGKNRYGFIRGVARSQVIVATIASSI